MLNDDKNKKFDFINEKVLNKKSSSQGPMRIIIFVIACAMLFGVVSCLTFYWAKPFIKDYLNGNENEKDSIPGEDETTTDKEIEEATTISVEEAVKAVLERCGININDHVATYEQLGAIGETMEKSMATIVSYESEEWFSEEKSTAMVTSGIIVKASIEDGIIILTDSESVKNSQSLMVYLHNGKLCKAELYKSSQTIGIALIRIASGAIDEKIVSELSAIDISLLKDQQISGGEEVILMGNPYGKKRFMASGVITSIANIVGRTDIWNQLMTTDIQDSGLGNGFIIDLEGNIIGMVIDGVKPERADQVVSAVYLEDIVPYLDKLMQGNNISYLGINGQEITDEIIGNTGKEMPYGIYINGTETDSPAYISRIMKGDILVEIGEHEVTDSNNYMEALQSYESGASIDVAVMREGKDGYKKIIYAVKIESR